MTLRRFALIILIGFFPCSNAAVAADDLDAAYVDVFSSEGDDHGNTRTTATHVALPSTTAGAIDPGRDTDWFRFEVSARGVVVMESSGDLDTVGTLFDAGNRIVQDDDGAGYPNFRIERTLDAGAYYVRVHSSGTATGGYTLHLRGDGGSGSATVAPGESFRDCDTCPLMVSIPAGSFLMGAPESEPWSENHERPQRTVSVPAFTVSAYEVTFAEWDACVAEGGCGGYSPDDLGWGRGDRPVINVNWDDAQLYVAWLSRKTGQTYRLPTEAEWEYAARAGTTTPFHTGGTISPQQANFDGRSGYPDSYDEGGLYRGQTVPVGSFASNAFGLHDVHGNVWEWVQDCYGSYGNAPSNGSASEVGGCSVSVLRGGSWVNGPGSLRSAYRGRGARAYDRHDVIGFRVARTAAGAGTGDEHGNTRSTATHVGLPSTTAGTIDPGNDTDWFRFEVRARGAVVMESSGDLDTLGTLFDASGNRTVQDDDGAGYPNFRIERELEVGTYYVRVHSSGRATGGYTLHLRGDVHGNSRASATRVALPSATTGTIDPGRDTDWFRFEVPATGVVVMESSSELDTLGTLFDASGNRIVQDDDGGDELNFRIERTLDAGTYYVRVHSYQTATGGYTLHLRGESFRDCDTCPPMISVPAGSFLMGAPESETHSLDSERPRRTVSVPAFAASAYEVTFAEWDACVAEGGCGGYSPDDFGWGRGDRPVINVSWDDVQLYVAWLSRKTGETYRLPTEAEWEYAARAGTTTPFHTGGTISPQQANFNDRYGYPNGYDEGGLFRRQTVPVGSFAPNAFGLHDVHGNVWEWVQDCWNGSHAGAPRDGSAWLSGDCSERVLRGGSWSSRPSLLRAAFRGRNATGYRNPNFGFRVARTLGAVGAPTANDEAALRHSLGRS